MPLPSDLLKKVLVQLHSTVMPHIPNPLLLSDFLTRCLDEGGLVGMLALNGIFTLVTKHGLEYPNTADCMPCFRYASCWLWPRPML